MASTGIVREWDDDGGFGVINSADTPGGCWAHFSHLVMAGHRRLVPGSEVTFTFEAARQDGYGYRAVAVSLPGAPPITVREEPDGDSAAYQSMFTIRWPSGTLE